MAIFLPNLRVKGHSLFVSIVLIYVDLGRLRVDVLHLVMLVGLGDDTIEDDNRTLLALESIDRRYVVPSHPAVFRRSISEALSFI